MKWQYKAKIMKVCANIPKGDKIYKGIQRKFGRLGTNPLSRIPIQIEMARWILDQGREIKGKTFFEVGTGHKPIIPIGFFLSGAESVITMDLNVRLDYELTQSSLLWMTKNRETIESLYSNIVNPEILKERFTLVERLWSEPKIFLKEAGIQYLAPADAADTKLPDSTIDYHFSVTTLEHIPEHIIKDIFIEADRILTGDGLAIHFVDPSDHFAHQDKSITTINFLKFTKDEWKYLAGNEFAYCNRLRASDYLDILKNLSFEVIRSQSIIDDDALTALENGFPLNDTFKTKTFEDLCITDFRVLLEKRDDGVE